MLPLITKFNSDSVIYDASGSLSSTYVSMCYDKNNIYFLNDVNGSVTSYDTSTEATSTFDAIKNGDCYSILKYDNKIYGFDGYDVKKYTNDTVLYIRDNNILVQESFDRTLSVVLLSSKTEIRDYFIDEDYNYYVIHNVNCISKFSKDRILKYKYQLTPTLSGVFNQFFIMPNNTLEIIKMDFVREYTIDGLKSYPIIMGIVTDDIGYNYLSAGQMFLAKLDEQYIGTDYENTSAVSYAQFNTLTAKYYSYDNPMHINYKLTGYDYLKNTYTKTDILTFKVVLENVYNNLEKIRVEIPISKFLFQSEYHHFAFRLDGLEGKISVFCDGNEISTVDIPPGQYIFQDIMDESINVGNTYFHNNISLPEYLNQTNYYIKNLKLKQFKIYNKALSNNEIDFHVYNGIEMQDLVVSLPCDQRNELDGIERQFKLDTTGNKSNKINLIIKNSQISNNLLKTQLKDILAEKLKSILPATTTINNIEFR